MAIKSLGGGDGGREEEGGGGESVEIKKKKKIMQPLQICIQCIGPTIRLGRESWCLPYAGFFRWQFHITVNSMKPMWHRRATTFDEGLSIVLSSQRFASQDYSDWI